MNISTNELQTLSYNPHMVIHKVLSDIGKTNNSIPDVTSPFMMLLEATATLTNDAMEENIRHHRKLFPSLASSKEDLWSHIHDYDYINLFALPVEAKIIFLLNVLDIRQYGIDYDTYREVTIPATSTVTVNNHIFTLLNDITIHLYKDNRAYVEQNTNLLSNNAINPISIQDIGILNSVIIKDNNDIEYLTFETRVKQTHREVIEGTIIKGIGFHKEITLSDNEKYWWSEVYIRKDNQWIFLNITHSDIVYDKDKPTVWIKYLNDTVTYKIPNLYTSNLYGNIRIVLYTTKGKVALPLDTYEIGEFKIDLEDTGKTTSTAVSSHINMFAKSITNCVGGMDNRTLEDVRGLIINDATINYKLPITEKQLEESIYTMGYNITLHDDIVTNRIFSAYKFDILNNDINPDVKAKISHIVLRYVLDGRVNNTFVEYMDTYNSLMIKSNSIFKYINGVSKLVSDTEYGELTTLTNNDRLTVLLNENRYFYNPFHIVINYDRGIVQTRMYMLDTPKIHNKKILSKNNYLVERVNSVSYSIYKQLNGYELGFTVIGNREFKSIPKSSIYGQLKLMVNDVPVYYKGVYDVVRNLLVFNIVTDFMIDNNHKLHMAGYTSIMNDVWFDLKEEGELIIYSDSPILNNNTYSYNSNIEIGDGVALDVEYIDIEFGYHLPYLWNKILSNYKEREPKRYKDNIPAFYEEDVYRRNDDGSVLNIIDGKVVYDIIHRKGTPVLDDLGRLTYEHRIGDIMYGDDGLPIIDDGSRISRTIDIPVFEYEFKVVNNIGYVEYYQRTTNHLYSQIRNDMDYMNKKVLDNSTIYFKPSKSLTNVSIKMNGGLHYNTPTIEPIVKLYVINDLNIEIAEIEDRVGLILDEYLENSEIKIDDIRGLLIKDLGQSVVGIKVLGVTELEDIEAFTIVGENRLNIRKKIERDIEGKMIVRYKVRVEIINV